MSSRNDSYKRLINEGWSQRAEIRRGLAVGNAELQSIKKGSGSYIYDEYSILIEKMPPNKSPENFLADMAKDLNGTVNNKDFDSVNIFKRRGNNIPKVGDIVDINIFGPDNGSVILAEKNKDYFIFQTVKSLKYGSHPEFGSREFGFEKIGEQVKFYTRGVSRPANAVVGFVGSRFQKKGWSALVTGIGNSIEKQGGKVVGKPINIFSQRRQI